MWAYLKRHERFMTSLLKRAEKKSLPPEELQKARSYHLKKIEFFQHERLIHLWVTLFISLFLLLSLGFSMVHKTWTGLALSILLLILTTAYLIHYFHLENGVQRFYAIWEKLEILTKNMPTPPEDS